MLLFHLHATVSLLFLVVKIYENRKWTIIDFRAHWLVNVDKNARVECIIFHQYWHMGENNDTKSWVNPTRHRWSTWSRDSNVSSKWVYSLFWINLNFQDKKISKECKWRKMVPALIHPWSNFSVLIERIHTNLNFFNTQWTCPIFYLNKFA